MPAGGPGETFIKPETLLLFSDGFLGRILDALDVVCLDHRAAPDAVSNLDCPKAYGVSRSTFEQGLEEAQSLEVGREVPADCVAQARRIGVDLDQYNNVRMAADIDAARQAFGHDRIACCGASHGTQLGQHFIATFPAASPPSFSTAPIRCPGRAGCRSACPTPMSPP